MTAPRSTLRQRRATGADAVPRAIARWFAGETPHSMTALAFPWYPLLPEYWLAWVEAHAGARPPAGFEWLATDDALSRYPEWLVAQARRCLAGSAT